MISQLPHQLVLEAFAALDMNLADGGSPSYDWVFDDLFVTYGKGLTVVEQLVLYPQFRAILEPALLGQLRIDGDFGVVDGNWQRVADSRALQEARSGGYLTPEEVHLQDRALGRN